MAREKKKKKRERERIKERNTGRKSFENRNKNMDQITNLEIIKLFMHSFRIY